MYFFNKRILFILNFIKHNFYFEFINLCFIRFMSKIDFDYLVTFILFDFTFPLKIILYFELSPSKQIKKRFLLVCILEKRLASLNPFLKLKFDYLLKKSFFSLAFKCQYVNKPYFGLISYSVPYKIIRIY